MIGGPSGLGVMILIQSFPATSNTSKSRSPSPARLQLLEGGQLVGGGRRSRELTEARTGFTEGTRLRLQRREGSVRVEAPVCPVRPARWGVLRVPPKSWEAGESERPGPQRTPVKEASWGLWEEDGEVGGVPYSPALG